MATLRGRKQHEKRMLLRERLWPEITDQDLWVRQDHDGYTTLPRTMPLLMEIMNDLTKGKPVGATYLALWCRVFDESFVSIRDTKQAAYEVGFTAQRSEATWQKRIEQLEELGFIKTSPSSTSKFGHVLILNPYNVMYSLYKNKKIPEMRFNALVDRAQEISATDLDDLLKKEAAIKKKADKK